MNKQIFKSSALLLSFIFLINSLCFTAFAQNSDVKLSVEDIIINPVSSNADESDFVILYDSRNDPNAPMPLNAKYAWYQTISKATKVKGAGDYSHSFYDAIVHYTFNVYYASDGSFESVGDVRITQVEAPQTTGAASYHDPQVGPVRESGSLIRIYVSLKLEVLGVDHLMSGTATYTR